METVDYDWSDYMNVDALTKKKRSVAHGHQLKVKTLVNALVDMFLAIIGFNVHSSFNCIVKIFM